jgi:hypothetical protein
MNSGPNWARRHGPNRRLCARPGCGAPAAATLRFQPTQREAWLVELDDDAARTEGDLCARHAAGLVLPRGWQLHNALTTPLTIASEPTPPPKKTPRRVRNTSIARSRNRRTASGAVELPGLAAASDTQEHADEGAGKRRVPEAARPAVHARVPLVAAAASPEASEALADTLDVRTPLLRRAFSNVWLPGGNRSQEVDAG